MITAVLLSGGLDSAVLLAEAALGGEVQPLYVSAGLSWEAAERDAVRAFLASRAADSRIRRLTTLSIDMTDVFPPAHWAMSGRPPGYHTPDEQVYLPGRNIVLLSKVAVYCAIQAVDRLAIGTLDHNPFPDATPRFRQAIGEALSLGLDHRLQIDAPFACMNKSQVIRRGAALGVPLELTLSCMNPQAKLGGAGGHPTDSTHPTYGTLAYRHCGRCSKCRERHDAFVEAGVADPTEYEDLNFVKG